MWIGLSLWMWADLFTAQDSYWCTRRLSVQSNRCGCALGCSSRYHLLRQKKSGLDGFRVETKHKSKEEQGVNHVPHTKLSRLYSTAKTRDRSSASACPDAAGCEAWRARRAGRGEGRPPGGVQGGARGSHTYRGRPFLFLHHCRRPQRSPGVPSVYPFIPLISSEDAEWGSSAGGYRTVKSQNTAQVFKSNNEHDSLWNRTK